MTCIRTRMRSSAAWTRCCSTTCSPTARCAATPASTPSPTPSPPATTSSSPRRQHRRFVTKSTASCAARWATDASRRSSGNGTSGTTTSRRSTPACSSRELRSRAADAAGEIAQARGWRDDALRAGAAARRRHHTRAVVLAMTLAVATGMPIAVGRVYGGRADPRRAHALRRGDARHTGAAPALRDLLRPAPVVRLPAFVAALIGLGLNYAAYESEIYRSALEAVPRGQLEAARILGFSERRSCASSAGRRHFAWRWRR